MYDMVEFGARVSGGFKVAVLVLLLFSDIVASTLESI